MHEIFKKISNSAALVHMFYKIGTSAAVSAVSKVLYVCRTV